MATHRKTRTPLLTAPRTAAGLTTAALATVTLFSETAGAAPAPPPAPKQSITEVKAKVDSLTHQAEVATERYDGAKEKVSQQQATVNRLLAQASQKTQALNNSRELLGQYAAAQYRTGGDDSTGRYLMAANPQDLLDQTHMEGLLGARQKSAVDSFRAQQAAATQQRIEAAKSLATLTAQQEQLRTAKADVQSKLSEAQKLLNSLTAQQKARLAAIQAQQEAEARRKAAAFAAQQKAKELAAEKQKAAAAAAAAAAAKASTAPTTGTPAPAPSNTSVADKAIAFARAQLGDPYVWGATGPGSWDCSGLTQAAYKAAGVSLPRTTGEQINAGTRVSMSNLEPGDLVFFYSDASHVGIYIGGGEIIHAPHTGTVVKIAPVTEMPFYGAVRPS